MFTEKSFTADSSERNLIDELLEEQQSLTAVERFSQKHANATEPVQSRFYRDLIPLGNPQLGEQYSFEVDLDACTGCKACVTACNTLNGLDADEAWRDTSMIIGGEGESARRQVVTSACHHCADPACASGCPVLAYNKDEATGIVRHLDDQCIGCQYCILTCPYDVPKFNDRLGIVRKCDMCQSRLAEGEAPACVQACPSEAIKISVVKIADLKSSGHMLPGMVDSSFTQPSTIYKSAKPLPVDTIPADFYDLTPQHGHTPLVLMLTLTQFAVGVFLFQFLFSSENTEISRWFSVAGLALGLAGIAASVFHLGQPLKAWRCFLGLKKSWLSREIVAFGLWMPLAFLLTASPWLGFSIPFLESAALLIGLLSVFCSVMVYAVTPRPFWAFHRSAIRFFGTIIVGGLAGGLAFSGGIPWLVAILAIALTAKVLFEMSALIPAKKSCHWSPAKHTALLQIRPLRRWLIARLVFFGLSLILLPVTGSSSIMVMLVFLSIFGGEICARSLFFRSVSTLTNAP